MKTVKLGNKRPNPSLVAFIVIFALVGGYILTKTFAATGSATANVWVSSSGSDTGSNCKQFSTAVANPDTGGTTLCKTFDKAYKLAQPGDTVLVRPGTYPLQTLTDDATKDGNVSDVTIKPDGVAGTATVGNLTILASHIVIKDIWSTGQADSVDPQGGHHITVDGFKGTKLGMASCETSYSQYPTNCAPLNHVTIKNSEFGPITSDSGSFIKTLSNSGDGTDPTGWPTDITLDNNYFHDYKAATASTHIDCLHVFRHLTLVIRNNKFFNCGNAGARNDAGYDILFGSNADNQAHSLSGDLIENNIFGPAGIAGFALRGDSNGSEQFKDGPTVRYNSGTSITPQVTNTLVNLHWYGNVAEDLVCRTGISYDHNVSASGGCGPTDQTAPTGFASATDYHLITGAAAIDHGATAYPATDKDGKSRPMGVAADAGAYEYGSDTTPASLKGDLNNDNTVNVFDLSRLLSNYGKTTSTGDLNSDGVVNVFDLSILLSNYGKTAMPTTELNTHQTLGFNTLSGAASDDFTGSTGTKPSSSKWGAKQFSASNGSVVYWNGMSNAQLDGNGNLDIFAQKTTSGWNSSWLSGVNSYTGSRYMEARAKVPAGAGTWSAPIWEWEAPYGSTALENDVIEQLGTEPSSYHTTLHANSSLSVGKAYSTSQTLSNDYHIYGAAVYADHVDYYFDGNKIQTITKAELGNNWGFVEKQMVLNIDLDMGGWGGTPSSSLPSTVHLVVDYIRVYTP